MDYIKANRKGSREAEIENHGHPVSFNRVHVSKKVYNRKRDKADARRLVRVPVNSFEFHSCERTPQVEYLLRLRRHRMAIPEASALFVHCRLRQLVLVVVYRIFFLKPLNQFSIFET